MKYPTRRYITEPERQMIFDRWFKGESQNSIARSLGARSYIDSRRPVTKRRHPAAASQAFSTRSKVSRTRRDLPRHCCRTLYPFDRC